MSGRDEKPRIKLPVCPRCGKEPDFWILNLEVPKCIWLFSDEYLKKYPQFEKVTSSWCDYAEWVSVRSVRCGHDNDRLTLSHTFGKHINEHEKVFREVLEQTKYYIGIGRVRRS